MNCPNCGAELLQGGKFCHICGQAVPAKCSACGAELAAGAKFCHMCGAAVGAEAPNAEPKRRGRPPKARVEAEPPKPAEKAPTRPASSPAAFDTRLPGEEAAEPSGPSLPVPNAKNFGALFFVRGSQSKACQTFDGKWQLEVQRRFNDDYAEDTDPEHFLYGSFDIEDKKSGQVVHGLSGLQAYALSGRGIYYAKKEGYLCFMDSSGTVRQLGLQNEPVISVYVENGETALATVCFVYVKGYSQTAWNEHRDECGYMFEAWYDVYDLDVGVQRIRVAP